MAYVPSPEIAVLLASSERDMSDEQVLLVRDIVASTPDIDWGHVVEQAARHRVIALMGRNLERAGLFRDGTVPLRELYRSSHLYHQRRNEVRYHELATVLSATYDSGIRAAVRKGAYLAEHVYRDIGTRPMNDLDVLTTRADGARLTALLAELGYRPGRPDPTQHTISPPKRAEELFWRLRVNNLPTMHKLSDDPHVQIVSVDICVDLFLPGSGYRVDTQDLLNRLDDVTIAGQPAMVLPPAEFAVDVAAHLHKESTTLRYIKRGKHQRLIQYWDLLGVVESAAPRFDWDHVAEIALHGGIQVPMYFAFAHLELLRPGSVPESFLAALRASEPRVVAALDEFAAVDLAQPLVWDRDFLSRMFDRRMALQLPESRSLV